MSTIIPVDADRDQHRQAHHHAGLAHLHIASVKVGTSQTGKRMNEGQLSGSIRIAGTDRNGAHSGRHEYTAETAVLGCRQALPQGVGKRIVCVRGNPPDIFARPMRRQAKYAN